LAALAVVGLIGLRAPAAASDSPAAGAPITALTTSG